MRPHANGIWKVRRLGIQPGTFWSPKCIQALPLSCSLRLGSCEQLQFQVSRATNKRRECLSVFPSPWLFMLQTAQHSSPLLSSRNSCEACEATPAPLGCGCTRKQCKSSLGNMPCCRSRTDSKNVNSLPCVTGKELVGRRRPKGQLGVCCLEEQVCSPKQTPSGRRAC